MVAPRLQPFMARVFACSRRAKRRAIIIIIVRCLAGALLWLAPAAYAQHLPFHRYDVADGLAGSDGRCIYQDSKGYLWFGTGEGLSRFDGYRFTNYSVRDGLPHQVIDSITEDREGRLWMGTNGGGVARLIDDPQEDNSLQKDEKSEAPKKKFVSYAVGDSPNSSNVNALLFDARDNLWCATDAGLYRATNVSRAKSLRFELAVQGTGINWGQPLREDHHGRVWFGNPYELVQIEGDRMVKYKLPDEPEPHKITSIVEDRDGGLFVATERSVFKFSAPDDGRESQWQRLPVTLSAGATIGALLVDSSGALWIPANGLTKYKENERVVYAAAQGLNDSVILSFCEDREGNLWIGSGTSGVYKLSANPIISFTPAEGLPGQAAVMVVEDGAGHIYASTGNQGIAEITGERAMPVPGSLAPPFNNINGRMRVDRRGNLWIGAGAYLYRFAKGQLDLRRGEKFRVVNTEFAADKIDYFGIYHRRGGIYEDLTGRMWISVYNGHTPNLYWLNPSRRRQDALQLVPPEIIPLRTVDEIISDSSGGIWMAYQDRLGKFVNDKTIFLQPTEGLPETHVTAFFVDSRGWLWMGLRYKGLSMTKNPSAEHPAFVNYTMANGLAGDTVRAITEDDAGRMYIGTTRGFNQLNPATNHISHFDVTDGLAGETVYHCFKDHHGDIWFATNGGVSKFNPHTAPREHTSPIVYLSYAQAAGRDLSLPERGTRAAALMSLEAARNNLQIEYVGLSYQDEQSLKYQYKLEGIDKDWSAPTEQRAVNYASLAPGSYRFLVRAINREGMMSQEAAALPFRILPPVWERWWFLSLVMVALSIMLLALHRFRLRQVIAMERIRRQIATDLHDDVGSGLSQVAILSEVVKREASPASAELLNEVAGLARAMRESMSDIVWAVDPRKDSLFDLVQRTRQTAYNLFEADGLHVEFSVAGEHELERVNLESDRRRHLLFIFKETLTNIARHAHASHVRIEVKIEAGELRFTVRDNGCGFNPQSQTDGHGLDGLKQRAAELHARLQIESTPAGGTLVRVALPLKRRDFPQ